MAQHFWAKNMTGGTISAGTVVRPDPANSEAVVACPASELDPIGVAVDNVVDGAWGRFAHGGVVPVRIDNAGAVSREWFVCTSAMNAGQGTASTIPVPPTDAVHFREIGHTIQDRGAGVTTPVLCVLHFN